MEKNIESIVQKESENYRVEVRPKLWDKLEKRMDDHYETTTPDPVVRLAWLRYAAATLLLLSAGFLISRLDTSDKLLTAEQYTLEEISNSSEDDHLYENMIHFSQKMYRPLVSSGASINGEL
jgi:hypothetical protein